MSPQITGEGGSGILLTPNTWFFHQSSKPQARVRACQLTSDTISVELVPMPQVELSTLPWLQMPAMWSCLIMLLTKRLKFVLPMTPTPCSKTQSNQRPNSGILLLIILTLRYRIKSDTVKWRRSLGHGRSGGEWGFHAMLGPAPSPQDHLLSLHKLSEPLFMDFYWAFTR